MTRTAQSTKDQKLPKQEAKVSTGNISNATTGQLADTSSRDTSASQNMKTVILLAACDKQIKRHTVAVQNYTVQWKSVKQ